jgi:hypothetical protein
MLLEPLIDLVEPFIQLVKAGQVEVYNEFSLQHELGLFLRSRLKVEKVQFERNVSYFFPSNKHFTKREIDIAIFSPDLKELRYAIELKYPRNGQYPEQMFSFCRDIAFGEEVKAAGFQCAGVLILAEDPLFYQGPGEGIYGCFRAEEAIAGSIQKPTGARDGEVVIRGSYIAKWRTIRGPLKCAVVEVADVAAQRRSTQEFED